MKFYKFMTSQDSSVQLVDQAVLLFTLGEEKEAESLLVEYLSKHENDLSAWRALSEIRLSTKDFSAAEHACRKALSINPDDLTSNVSLARILVSQGDKEGAEEASSKARVLGWKDELAQDEHNG
jgi:predicted Zn-dependent protease